MYMCSSPSARPAPPGSPNPGEVTEAGQPSENATNMPGHHAELLHLCAARSLPTPVFDIEGDGFGGWLGVLTVGDLLVENKGTSWQTKKAAKQGLAELGVDAVKGMAQPEEEGDNKPWVLLLNEFYNTKAARAKMGGPVWTDYVVAGGFGCTCLIPEHPSPFGSMATGFFSKKVARKNAAMEAAQFLISEGLLNPDKNEVKIEKLDAILSADSYATRVNEICPILNIPVPIYSFVANSSDPEAHLLSAVAYFPNTPELPGPIGEVQEILGKKNARELCAREVFKVLMQIASNRGNDRS